ncbi:DUF1013 domain-containing protein [Commensalibacter oyaizuii]|uniref:DUF1013 domain-containing protein n=1 Tax=Commensalibacter oyaizuii TaxID=3043873 RepID=A0ABT6PZ34_9PROT|nr:cell cycle transcriptional regulator TrcR [Commensalibacter sp. TBRC 16381]MDI2090120.1 DUF1013 domain-containing protein [Commensalibacter sp. TBRC 16381]
MTLPLMPKATAVWLIEKTALTFTQIAEFCGMHPLEVQAIADGEVAQSIIGYDPVSNGQLTQEEISRCEADPSRKLRLSSSRMQIVRRSKGARYTPISKRNDRPDAIAFLLRNFPQLLDTQIAKLLGTTKDTISKVRDKQHWNSPNIKPRDPVILGLCSQMDLNAAIAEANERVSKEEVDHPTQPAEDNFAASYDDANKSNSSSSEELDIDHIFSEYANRTKESDQ